jgi:hypothetical protein
LVERDISAGTADKFCDTGDMLHADRFFKRITRVDHKDAGIVAGALEVALTVLVHWDPWYLCVDDEDYVCCAEQRGVCARREEGNSYEERMRERDVSSARAGHEYRDSHQPRKHLQGGDGCRIPPNV